MPNTINISFEGVNSEALMLATKQYCGISNGSACNSNSYKPSYVLSSMNLNDDIIKNAVRISWGKEYIHKNDFAEMLRAIEELV